MDVLTQPTLSLGSFLCSIQSSLYIILFYFYILVSLSCFRLRIAFRQHHLGDRLAQATSDKMGLNNPLPSSMACKY
jgi:hypothetical protein